jgi:hypothetical protein
MRYHAERGNDQCLRPALGIGDAARLGLRYHAERGNDQW